MTPLGEYIKASDIPRPITQGERPSAGLTLEPVTTTEIPTLELVTSSDSRSDGSGSIPVSSPIVPRTTPPIMARSGTLPSYKVPSPETADPPTQPKPPPVPLRPRKTSAPVGPPTRELINTNTRSSSSAIRLPSDARIKRIFSQETDPASVR